MYSNILFSLDNLLTRRTLFSLCAVYFSADLCPQLPFTPFTDGMCRDMSSEGQSRDTYGVTEWDDSLTPVPVSKVTTDHLGNGRLNFPLYLLMKYP